MPPNSKKRANATSTASKGQGKKAKSAAGKKQSPADAADKTNNQSSLATFTKWCTDRGFVLHPSLELRDITLAGSTRVSNAAYAKDSIKVNDILCEIPKEWCLTPTTGSLSFAIPSDDLEDLDETALILAVMYERARGVESPWAPYFNRLPHDHEPLPFLWSEEEMNELTGTEVSFRVKDDTRAMREDHSRITDLCRQHVDKLKVFFPDGVVPESVSKVSKQTDKSRVNNSDNDTSSDSDSESDSLEFEADDGPAGFNAFLSAASLVASRAFFIDETNGQGLVPVADCFNHRGNDGEHVHFEENDDDEDGEGDEIDEKSDSEDFGDDDSEDENVEAELKRLRGEEGETTFEEFENAVTNDEAKPVDPGENRFTKEHGLEGTSNARTLRLIAVKDAQRGSEVFNSFGNHGNAVLLHKYGFCEWDNSAGCGGVTFPVFLLIELFGQREVYYEAFASLEGGFLEEEDFEEEDDGDDDKNDNDAPWNSTEDALSAGIPIARASGWSGGVYEISPSGEISRDLLLLFATALCDPHDASTMDEKTGLPIGIEKCSDDDLLKMDGVAEATLAAIKARLGLLPERTVEGDLQNARDMSENIYENGSVPDTGVTGVAAAILFRHNERKLISTAFELLVERLKRLTTDGTTDDKTKPSMGKQPTSRIDSVAMQTTPYGAVVYLPKRGGTPNQQQ